MKRKPSVLVLSATFTALYLCQTAQMAAMQITFVQTPGQQRPQGQAGQPGLSPEKKKSLSKYGPEDAFPGAREQESNQKQSNKAATRKSATRQPSATPDPTPSPAITPSTVTAVSPTPTPQAPAPVATVAASTQINQSQTGKTGSSFLIPAALSAAILLVFGALVYVLGILRKKLKQES